MNKIYLPLGQSAETRPQVHRLQASDIDDQTPQSRNWRVWSSGIIGLTIGLVLTSLVFWKSTPSQKPSVVRNPGQSTVKHCGTTAAEARSLGCHFQLWSYSWTPQEWYDAELDKEFLDMYEREHKRQSWGYFTKRISPTWEDAVRLKELLKGEGTGLWSTHGQHWWHCAFYQKKFFRALEKARGRSAQVDWSVMADRDLNTTHGLHCQHVVASGYEDLSRWDKLDFHLTVGFQSCGVDV